MLSLTRDLIKKTQQADVAGAAAKIRPLTVCFWSDFTANPSIMYELFAPNPRKLNYDPDKVKVMGTKDGMISQINVSSVEELESFVEQILAVPLLLRICAHFVSNDYFGAAQTDTVRFESDMALLVDTSHPMIRPGLEKGLDTARKIMQSGQGFCLQVCEIDFSPSVDAWLRTNYPRGCYTIGRVRRHRASLYITNCSKPQHCFDCNALWCLLLGPCWLLSAPCYKLYRRAKCTDIAVHIHSPIVRRTVLAISGKVVEASK
jgi:hypothetical protein